MPDYLPMECPDEYTNLDALRGLSKKSGVE